MGFALKKIASTLATLLVVSLALFAAFQLISGDPATRILGTGATPERLAALRAELGLDQPLLVRYLQWLASFVRGDAGSSYVYQQPVTSLLAAKVPVTFALTGLSFALMCALGIPAGILCAKHAGSPLDRVLLVCDQVIMAIPSFFSGILISWAFGLVLHLFAPGGYVSYTTSVTGFLGYLVFPAIALALPRAAQLAKLLRGSILDEAAKDYARTAYSRGNDTSGVLYGHLLKNAFLPALTFLGMSLGGLLAGSLVVERVFNIPGISSILLASIGNRDYPVVLAAVMLIAVFVIVVNLLADILAKALDPRIGEE
jgi:peptide/nickel transport system permease protein